MKALALAADVFEDSELLFPLYRLREAGIQCDVAAAQPGTLVGKHGYEIDPDLTFGDVDPDDYGLLIIPGGKAPERMRLNDAAVSVTRRMFEAGKVVAAICHGAQVLISAGVLSGVRATCYEGIRDDVKAAGADYSDEEVVVDGHLITSRCPSDLPAFCREMMKAIG
jgi:protease I